ncbi:hypothetical protein M0R19_03855 [Candidatus Pacearchaeota archaeon]|nr:hypothetical protein [Candidatus Pacearchaeota archaeon]
MNTFVNNWKEFLKESTIDTENFLNISLAVAQEMSNNFHMIRLILFDNKILKNYSKDLNEEILVKAIIGAISMQKCQESKKLNTGGLCYGAYQIHMSFLRDQYKGQGIGKLLYGLASAWICQNDGNKEAGICADRESTTEEAENVWLSINKDSSWESFPPKIDDINDKKPHNFDGFFDDPFGSRTIPEEDDCALKTTKKGLSSSDHLNRSYRTTKNVGDYIKLTLNYESILKLLHLKISNKKLLKSSKNLFSRIYN